MLEILILFLVWTPIITLFLMLRPKRKERIKKILRLERPIPIAQERREHVNQPEGC
jgi:hypothetical protein